MKTLSLMTLGLMTFAAAGLAAPGGGNGSTTGMAVGTAGGGNAASAATAAHVASLSAGVNHAVGPNIGGGFRSANVGAASGASSLGGIGRVGAVSRSPGLVSPPGAAVRALPTVPTVHNAWSDPVNPRVAGTFSANARVLQTSNNTRMGQFLYPGAYGYTAANRPAGGQFRHGRAGYDGVRGSRRYYYNNFPYPVYYPYLYGGVGYDGLAGNYAGFAATDGGVADLGAPDFSTASNNYYSQTAPTTQNPTNADPSAAAQQQSPLPPDAPAVGPQNPPPAAAQQSGDNAQRGPDSLVEAVQDELTKRGYFAGRLDSVYSDATKEAIRRFQTDQNLPATGPDQRGNAPRAASRLSL